MAWDIEAEKECCDVIMGVMKKRRILYFVPREMPKIKIIPNRALKDPLLHPVPIVKAWLRDSHKSIFTFL